MNQQSVYNHLPIFAQQLAIRLYSAKLYHNRYSGAFNDYYESLLKSENSSSDDIRRYKEENIFKVLDYAYRHCPYYKESFRKANVTPNDFKKIDDLKKFPTLQKEDVRNNINGMISDEYSIKDLIHYHTSGSTGKGLDFYWTKDSQHFSWAVVWRGRKRFGIDKGDLQLDFTGKLVAPISQKKPPFWRLNPYLNQYMINMQHFTHDNIAVH